MRKLLLLLAVLFWLCAAPASAQISGRTFSPGRALTAPVTLGSQDNNQSHELTAAGTYTIPDVGTTGFTQGQLLNTAGVPVTISRQSASTFTLFGAQTGTALTSFSLLAGQAVTLLSSPNNNWDGTVTGLTTPWYNVSQFGAVGDGVTDDTAAIQSALSYFSLGGAGSTQKAQLYFSSTVGYKITNTLVYEGSNIIGIRMVGNSGLTQARVGSRISWFGPQGGTMLLMLGTNASS